MKIILRLSSFVILAPDIYGRPNNEIPSVPKLKRSMTIQTGRLNFAEALRAFAG